MFNFRLVGYFCMFRAGISHYLDMKENSVVNMNMVSYAVSDNITKSVCISTFFMEKKIY